ncbi:MAG: ribonuclease P protein component [Bacilli bacterium]|nr:ribonuclease P protein component [Bacilli bacterium]
MKKKFIVKKSYEFDNIIKNNDIVKNKGFIIYKKENKLDYNRFGISVGKKLGNAVYRNKMKRRIKNIIDSINTKNNINYDYIVILRSMGKNYKYRELQEKLTDLLK